MGAMAPSRVPLVDYLVLEPEPHLVANQCTGCGARYFDRRNACAGCFGTEFERQPVATTGGVLAAGNLMGGAGGIGQQLQKQIGQTGIPVYNVANACATGATALRTAVMSVKAGECDMGLAVGVEKLAGAGLLAGGARKQDSDTWTPSGRYGAVASVDGRIGTETMPGVFAQIGMEYGHRYGGTSFELFARISEKNHAHSTLNPLASYQKRFTLDEIMNDVMIAYPNTRPMCSANCDGAAAAVVVGGSKLKTLSLSQQQRPVKVAASA